jgi:hypothetical protein
MSSVRGSAPALAGITLLALVLTAPSAQAQLRRFGIPGVGGTLNPGNYYDPYGFARRAAFNTRLYGRAMAQVPPYALGYNPYGPAVIAGNSAYGGGYYGGYAGSPGYGSGNSPGYDGYDGYYSGYSSYDSYGSFLQGAARVISADGQFRINNQQANLLREQVRSAHIDNRRKAFDEFLYERAHTPTWLDDLERQRKLNLRYALTNAAASEILSAGTLNTLLDSVKQLQARGVKGPDIGINPDTLEKINVSAGKGVNPALLKNERLSWPSVLTRSEFTEHRKTIERNLATAVREAEVGHLEAKRLQDLRDEVDRLSDRLGQQIDGMTPTQYIDARNYLQLLGAGVRLLERPDGGNYVNGRYTARGKTVSDLVQNMAGLQFAPASPGSEQAYRDVYEKLVAYYFQAQPSSQSQ